MRIPVTCPSCDKTGALPEAMRGQRVTCPGCHRPFLVGVRATAAKARTASHQAVLDDDDDMPYDIQPLRRSSTRPSTSAAPTSSVPATLFVGLGIGAACSVFLTVVILLALGDSSAKPTRLAERQPTATSADSTP